MSAVDLELVLIPFAGLIIVFSLFPSNSKDSYNVTSQPDSDICMVDNVNLSANFSLSRVYYTMAYMLALQKPCSSEDIFEVIYKQSTGKQC